MASRSVPGGAAWTRMRTACAAEPPRPRQDPDADGDADDRVDPAPAGDLDDDGADDDADDPTRVGEHLEVGALDVERLLRARRAGARTRRG